MSSDTVVTNKREKVAGVKDFIRKTFNLIYTQEKHELQYWNGNVARKIHEDNEYEVKFGSIRTGNPKGFTCNCLRMVVTELKITNDLTNISDRHTDLANMLPDRSDQYVCASQHNSTLGCFMSSLCEAFSISRFTMRARMLDYQRDSGFETTTKLIPCLFPKAVNGNIVIPVDLIFFLLPEFKDKTNIWTFFNTLLMRTYSLFGDLELCNRIRYFLMEGRIMFMKAENAAEFAGQVKKTETLEKEMTILKSNSNGWQRELDGFCMRQTNMDSIQRQVLVSISELFDEVEYLRQCVAHQARKIAHQTREITTLKWHITDTDTTTTTTTVDADADADVAPDTSCMCVELPTTDILYRMFPAQQHPNMYRGGQHTHTVRCVQEELSRLCRNDPFADGRPILEREMGQPHNGAATSTNGDGSDGKKRSRRRQKKRKKRIRHHHRKKGTDSGDDSRSSVRASKTNHTQSERGNRAQADAHEQRKKRKGIICEQRVLTDK